MINLTKKEKIDLEKLWNAPVTKEGLEFIGNEHDMPMKKGETVEEYRVRLKNRIESIGIRSILFDGYNYPVFKTEDFSEENEFPIPPNIQKYSEILERINSNETTSPLSAQSPPSTIEEQKPY